MGSSERKVDLTRSLVTVIPRVLTLPIIIDTLEMILLYSFYFRPQICIIHFCCRIINKPKFHTPPAKSISQYTQSPLFRTPWNLRPPINEVLPINQINDQKSYMYQGCTDSSWCDIHYYIWRTYMCHNSSTCQIH